MGQWENASIILISEPYKKQNIIKTMFIKHHIQLLFHIKLLGQFFIFNQDSHDLTTGWSGQSQIVLRDISYFRCIFLVNSLLKKGQPVWTYEPARKVGICNKLTSPWKGPFIIEKQIDDVTYRVKKSARQPSRMYHVDRLALYQGRNIASWAARFMENQLTTYKSADQYL
jgi:hypothetical protein